MMHCNREERESNGKREKEIWQKGEHAHLEMCYKKGDTPNFPKPNLQKLGGMRSCPISGTPLSFLCSNQENKKCVSSRY